MNAMNCYHQGDDNRRANLLQYKPLVSKATTSSGEPTDLHHAVPKNTERSRHDGDGKYFRRLHFRFYFSGLICGVVIQAASFVACAMIPARKWGTTTPSTTSSSPNDPTSDSTGGGGGDGDAVLHRLLLLQSIMWVSFLLLIFKSGTCQYYLRKMFDMNNYKSSSSSNTSRVIWTTRLLALSGWYIIAGVMCGTFLASAMFEGFLLHDGLGMPLSLHSIFTSGAINLTLFLIMFCYHQRIYAMFGPDGDDNDDGYSRIMTDTVV